jgi:hypothetical protein
MYLRYIPLLSLDSKLITATYQPTELFSVIDDLADLGWAFKMESIHSCPTNTPCLSAEKSLWRGVVVSQMCYGYLAPSLAEKDVIYTALRLLALCKEIDNRFADSAPSPYVDKNGIIYEDIKLADAIRRGGSDALVYIKDNYLLKENDTGITLHNGFLTWNSEGPNVIFLTPNNLTQITRHLPNLKTSN